MSVFTPYNVSRIHSHPNFHGEGINAHIHEPTKTHLGELCKICGYPHGIHIDGKGPCPTSLALHWLNKLMKEYPPEFIDYKINENINIL